MRPDPSQPDKVVAIHQFLGLTNKFNMISFTRVLNELNPSVRPPKPDLPGRSRAEAPTIYHPPA